MEDESRPNLPIWEHRPTACPVQDEVRVSGAVEEMTSFGHTPGLLVCDNV